MDIGGMLVRQPDLVIPARTITTQDGAVHQDPGGTIARWQLPGHGIVQYTVYNGINTTFKDDGMPIARAFAAIPAEERPTVNFFDYRGFGESQGIPLNNLRFGQMRADARHVLNATTGPQILIGASMGGQIALLHALKEYQDDQREHAPRKIMALILANPAYNFTRLPDIEARTQRIVGAMERDNPGSSGLTVANVKNFMREADHHVLQTTLSPHGIQQPTLRCPVIVLQGDHDPLIPPEHSKELVRDLAAPAKLYVPLEDGHTFTGGTMRQIMEKKWPVAGQEMTLPQWLGKALRPDRGWLIRQHGLPQARRTAAAKAQTAAATIWQAACAAGRDLTRRVVRNTNLGQELRRNLARLWPHGGKSRSAVAAPRNDLH